MCLFNNGNCKLLWICNFFLYIIIIIKINFFIFTFTIGAFGSFSQHVCKLNKIKMFFSIYKFYKSSYSSVAVPSIAYGYPDVCFGICILWDIVLCALVSTHIKFILLYIDYIFIYCNWFYFLIFLNVLKNDLIFFFGFVNVSNLNTRHRVVCYIALFLYFILQYNKNYFFNVTCISNKNTGTLYIKIKLI